MQELLVTGIMIIVLGTTSMVASAPDPDASIKFETMQKAGYTVMFNNIAVPGEVLTYAQMKYQGHAVTRVEKIKRASQDIYRLRVDRDDQGTEGFYLLFDKDWKLLGDEKDVPTISKPVPAVKPAEPTQPTQESRPAQPQPQPTAQPQPTPPQPETQEPDRDRKPDKPPSIDDEELD